MKLSSIQSDMIAKLAGILLLFTVFNAYAFENLVYTWRGFPSSISQGTTALNNLKAHANQIHILSSQAYHINDKGVVYGAVNPQMTAVAKAAHVKVMPLVGNTDFDRKLTHAFLTDAAAQERAIKSLLDICQKNHFDGLQIDFEGMSFLDRDAFTHFYTQVAEALHKNGFAVSIAIIPMLTDEAPATDYLKGRFSGWSGVYDYAAIGKVSDFVTLMAYDQHGGATPPGPMAGFTWDEAIIQYALKYIPANKLSLGIPWHSGYWRTGSGNSSAHAVGTDLNYVDAARILQDKKATLAWDDKEKIHYAVYTSNYLYEYMFLEDADSFRAKLDLVKKYKLRGVSNWVLGEEDPKVWDVLPQV